MQVKIKKEGKTKTFNLIKKWSDVTLETWLKLIDFEKGTKTEEATETIAALSNIPKNLVKELALADVAQIMSLVGAMQQEQDSVLKRLIMVNKIEYGFHPNLDDITLGEYADIETYIKAGIEKHLPELMAVLYRPIKEKKNDIYIIEAYDGDIRMRAEEMKLMSAEQVQSALVFFYNFGKVLSGILPLYLMERQKGMKVQ
tara:strand:+ start:1629 stop:2228 length:600 start_codon:yes stop_codon:yes gene_type:complete